MKVRLLLALAALWVPQAAWACEDPNDGRALIHSAAPARLPPGAVIVAVTFLSTDERALSTTGVRARVDRNIYGALPDREILVRVAEYSSCSHSFSNGHSGLLVAIPGPVVNGMRTVTAIEARRGDGYRLLR